MKRLSIVAILAIFVMKIAAADYLITDFGAKSGMNILNTAAIQKAIDECAKKGGGNVIVPKGKFMTGALQLKSGVTLYLEKKATLYGSTNPKDYVLNKNSGIIITAQLLFAAGAKNIGIAGQGTIDGQGAYFNDKDCNAVGITRPMLIRFDSCRDIIISDVTLRNAGVWMQHHFACDNLTIKNVKIYNHCNNCNDGMDINCCRNVTITGVTVDSDDDGICLKSTSLKPSENIKVSDCTISSHCNAMKIGTETLGDFKNISFSNCKVTPCKNKTVVNGRANGISAISIESVDGAAIENVLFTDITVKGTEAPIFVRLGNCGNTFDQKVTGVRRGSIKGITIQNVNVKNAGNTGCSITGIPGQKVENVHLSNITIRQEGGMQKVAAPKDNKENAYPEATMWGTLPATGFFVKNAKNVTFNNVQVFTKSKDDRPSLYKVDVEE